MGVKGGGEEGMQAVHIAVEKIRQRGLHNATDCTEWFATSGGILCGNFSLVCAVCGIFKLDKCYQPTGSCSLKGAETTTFLRIKINHVQQKSISKIIEGQ